MNITTTLIVIILFYITAEILTCINRKSTTFIFGYIAVLRGLVISLLILTILNMEKKYDNYDKLSEANQFKYELIQEQDSLIDLQQTIIDDMGNHCWESHDCDCPIFDGELWEETCEQRATVDAIWASQL